MILYLNAEVGGLSIRLKIKKKIKKIKIKTTNANRKQQQQKIKYSCQAGIRTTIACVESERHSHWSIVSYGKLKDLWVICANFCTSYGRQAVTTFYDF